jgi:hypothetical protein
VNKEKLFAYLEKQQSSELIKLLDDCYSCMKSRDIRNVFGDLEDRFLTEFKCDGEIILSNICKFMDDSLNGVYYAPFDINSKNFTDVPEETDMWFENLAGFLTESSHLSMQGNHAHAVQCFGILFTLINKLGSEDIVFADETGMWMLPIREEPCINAYLESAAAILEPDDYVSAVLPVIHYDSHSAFINNAYEKAKSLANKAQQALLDANIKQHNIRIKL